MQVTEVLSILSIGSITGGLVGAYFQSKFEHRKQVKEWHHELKKKRYLCLNMLLLAKLDVAELSTLQLHRPDINSETLLDKEICIELYNSVVFADKNVIDSLQGFINNPNYTSYTKVAFAIRKDLWGDQKEFSFPNIVNR